MATDVVVLFPGGYAPRTNGATPTVLESSGSLANAPQVDRLVLEFPITTDKQWLFELQNPINYGSGGTLRGHICAPTVSPGNTVMIGGTSLARAASGAITTDAFIAANEVSSAAIMPATAYELVEFNIPMTMTGVLAKDSLVIFVGRDANHGSNTCTTSVYLTDLNYEYTAL